MFCGDSNFLTTSVVRAVLLISKIFDPKSIDTRTRLGSNGMPDKDTDLNPLLAYS